MFQNRQTFAKYLIEVFKMSYIFLIFVSKSTHLYSQHRPNSLYFQSFSFQAETKFCWIFGVSIWATWSIARNPGWKLVRSILREVWDFRRRIIVPGVGGGGGGGVEFEGGALTALPVWRLTGWHWTQAGHWGGGGLVISQGVDRRVDRRGLRGGIITEGNW